MQNKISKEEMLEVDARFLLANERTLLAWVRTALAVIAGGLALTQFGDDSSSQVSFGILSMLFGATMSVIGYARFKAADKAVRRGGLPQIGHGPIIQVIGVVVFALIIVLAEIFIKR